MCVLKHTQNSACFTHAVEAYGNTTASGQSEASMPACSEAHASRQDQQGSKLNQRNIQGLGRHAPSKLLVPGGDTHGHSHPLWHSSHQSCVSGALSVGSARQSAKRGHSHQSSVCCRDTVLVVKQPRKNTLAKCFRAE